MYQKNRKIIILFDYCIIYNYNNIERGISMIFKKLTLHNFKSFKNLEFDISGPQNSVKKSVFIYGENGAGKSNLISAFSFLRLTLSTLNIQDFLFKFFHEKKEQIEQEEFTEFLNRYRSSIPFLIKENKLIGSNENMEIVYEFVIDNKNGSYSLCFDDEKLISEELKFAFEKNKVDILRIDSNKKISYFNKKIFKDNKYCEIIEDLARKYFGKHSVMAIINNEMGKNNYQYMTEKFDEKFISFLEEFNDFSVLCKFHTFQESFVKISDNVINNFEKGYLDVKESFNLENTEELLNYYFTSLYSDIKGVFYKKVIKDDKIKYKLMFRKMISGEIREIPYDFESTGTQKILELLPYFYQVINGETVLIDEVDTGIHDLLIEHMLLNIKDQMKGQLIITTHNSKLLENLNPESVYVINVDIDGNKEILSISDFEERVQANHNLKNRYFKGLFGGIPYLGHFDLTEIVNKIESKENENAKEKKS